MATERPWLVLRCPCCGNEVRKRVECVDAVRRAERAEAEVRKLRAREPHAHEFGPWQDDPAGVVRECWCGAVEARPEG